MLDSAYIDGTVGETVDDTVGETGTVDMSVDRVRYIAEEDTGVVPLIYTIMINVCMPTVTVYLLVYSHLQNS